MIFRFLTRAQEVVVSRTYGHIQGRQYLEGYSS